MHTIRPFYVIANDRTGDFPTVGRWVNSEGEALDEPGSLHWATEDFDDHMAAYIGWLLYETCVLSVDANGIGSFIYPDAQGRPGRIERVGRYRVVTQAQALDAEAYTAVTLPDGTERYFTVS